MAELRPRPPFCLSVLALSASVAEAAPPTYATWLGGTSAERTYAAAAGPGGTIVIAGRDPFALPGKVPAMACRVYTTPHGLAGAPTVAQLVDALRQASTGARSGPLAAGAL